MGFGHFPDASVGLFESDFDETHSAHPYGLHSGVVAEYGDFEAEAFHRFDDEFVFWNLEFDVIDRDGDQLFLCD